MATPIIRPPFTWLGRYASYVYVGLLMGLAALFRFLELDTLPPGLHTGEAQVGLQALNLSAHGTFPLLDAANGYAPLWTWLQAGSVKLFGQTELALRLWPALLGVLAVLVTWLWLKSWFGVRIAGLTAFLLAVTPWSVTASRNATMPALAPLLVALTLWAATRAYKTTQWWRWAIMAATLGLDLLGGPLGWLLAASVVIIGLVVSLKDHVLKKNLTAQMAGFGLGIAALGGLGVMAAMSKLSLQATATNTGLTASLSTIGHNLVNVLLMFNVRGDDSYHHNLAGEPMLNVFVGLMLIAGLLVSISRLHQRRYRLTLLLACIMLIPAIISTNGAPNAAAAIGALPFILLIAAIGISYMLELWYTTFPINSAARITGQTAMLILLSLTFFQGYTQYFRAWAASPQVYVAYNEGAVAIARYLNTNQTTASRFVVASSDEQPTVQYLANGNVHFQALAASGIATLPVAPGAREFVITTNTREVAVKNLKLKFPGGILRPHYSNFNQAEIYYTYEVTK